VDAGVRRLRRPALLNVPRIETVAVVLLALMLIALTSRRNADYLTSEALWRSVVSSWPSAVAHRNLATSLKLAGKRDEALEYFRLVAQARPEVRRIVGQELFELGRFAEAIDELRFFLATADPASEDARASHLLVGRSLVATARTAEAATEFEAILRAHPDDAAALRALADARLDLREFEQAAGVYRRYLSVQPEDANAEVNLGIALVSVGDIPDAVQVLRRAAERNPTSEKAHLNLAVALAQQGALADAAEHAARAAALAPHDGRARELLEQILSAAPRRTR
jgi:tetratricopeptide (TPR) repeat protein